MRRRGAAAAVALALVAGGCRAKDRSSDDRGVSVAPPADAAPRPRPAQLAHLTLKVLGMT